MRILGTGSAVPAQTLTNDMLSTIVDTSDEWIRSRTGIESRFIAEDETTLSLARLAAEMALDNALGDFGISRDQIGVVICATVSNEDRCPSLACYLQRDLSLREDILAFDLNAACSGFIYALIVASRLISAGSYALIVGTEVLSRLLDFTDRNTCVLFGDAAGAAVVAPSPGAASSSRSSPPVFEWVTSAKGDDEILSITDYIRMNGQAVFRFAVETLSKSIQAVVEKAQLTLDQIDLFICHQANERIIASAARHLGLPLERFFMNLARYGNTSAASIPLALDEALRDGLIQQGTTIVMAGFGGGLSSGAICLTWEQ
jgi:3-oxoacyl-[acyl-carrier-protein] synthase-3